ncbi:hypothetical protein B0H19DRAFT_1139098 [Mycena capillaripes]|nr:hypothetical protein B0H19DRAFT_1139098 [Mycena capillaripes]
MSALAAELVDSIVPFLCPAPPKRGHDGNNYLDKSTATHVGKCALISRGWVPASRRVLFYRVHVSQFTAHGFAKLFKRPERLTFLPFIRELEFRDGLVTHNWMNTVFPQIAKHLPSSISILVLNANHSGSPCSPAEHVCRSFSGVTQFELVGDWKLKFSDTLQCIASFPALEGLKVRLARDWDDRTPPEPSIRPAETLRSLNFGGHGMELLFDWIQESRIIVAELAVKFTFAPSLTSIQSTIQYIRSLGPSLTSLAVTFDDFWRPDSDLDAAFPADFLEANTRLRALYILAHPRQMDCRFTTSINQPTVVQTVDADTSISIRASNMVSIGSHV